MLTYGALCEIAQRHGVTITENVRAFVREVEEEDRRVKADARPLLAWEMQAEIDEAGHSPVVQIPTATLRRWQSIVAVQPTEEPAQVAAFRKVVRNLEQAHTGMRYGDEKRGSLTEYARGFGNCLIALQNGLYDAQKAAEPEPRQSPYDTPLMPAIEAFHEIKPLAGNDPIDWPEHFLSTVTSALSAAFNVYSQGASALSLSDDDLRYVQRVLESDAPEKDRQRARDLIVQARLTRASETTVAEPGDGEAAYWKREAETWRRACEATERDLREARQAAHSRQRAGVAQGSDFATFYMPAGQQSGREALIGKHGIDKNLVHQALFSGATVEIYEGRRHVFISVAAFEAWMRDHAAAQQEAIK